MDNSASTTPQDVTILLVEDHPGDARLIEEGFHDARISNTLHHVTDGAEALDFLYQREGYENAPHPDLVLLDWFLPRIAGEEVLEKMSTDPSLEHIPVIVLTGSDEQEDVITSYSNQANAYVTKPVDTDAFIDAVRSLEEFWLSVVRLPPHTEEE